MQLLTNYCKLLLTFCMISTGVFSLSVEDSQLRQSEPATPVTLEDALTGTLGAAGYGGSWESDDELRFTSSRAKVTIRGAETDKLITESDHSANIDEILSTKNNSPFSGASFSADKRYILITHGRVSLWRSSYLAKYDVFDTQTNQTEPLQPVPGGDQPQLQLVRWSPTNNSLAFVYENDIYYRDSAAIGTPIKQITSDGAKNEIYNGHTDWVYEEEMFGTNNALWFSPDSKQLAYIQFNDTTVERFTYLKYGEPGNRETIYPTTITINYPKSGTNNPTYKIRVVKDLSIPAPISTDIPVFDHDNYHYIGTVLWATNSVLSYVFLNRAQNQAIIHLWNGTHEILVDQFNEANGWIDVYPPKFNAAGTRFLSLEFVNQTTGGHYKHIVIRNAVGGGNLNNPPVPLTYGQLNVNSIVAWDEAKNKIYFSGTFSDGTVHDPSQTHVYSVDDSPTTNDIACLTCGITNVDHTDEPCLSNSATFSPGFTYFIHRCSGPHIPTTVIRRTIDNSVTINAVNNTGLRTKLASKKMPQIRNLVVPLPGPGGFEAKVRLLLPPDFDEKDTEKTYPLLIDVYGGPSSQQIGQGYGVNWGTSLVSDKNIIYGFIDGRGSAKQSKELMFQLNKKLGTVEIEDQIAVTKAVIGSQKYIDPNRTAIWGWSYGGYATAMAMSKDTENVFKCGISVAPVTNWLYYDTIYTERYMKLPTTGNADYDNWDSYNASDVTTHVENFKNKKFFLVHGNADDNVHYQQSMILSRALEQNDIMFHQLSYPDENHGISGPGMRRHLYHSLQQFLLSTECFAEAEKPQTGTASSHFTHSALLALVFSIFMFHLY